MADELIIFGSGGHAKVMVEAVLARSPKRRIVLIDDDPEAVGKTVLGMAVAGGRDWLSANLPDAAFALGIGNNRTRAMLADQLRAAGRRIETVIHPAAIVGASVRVEEGAFIAAGAVLIAEARIGRAAIVNTGASVDHDCEIGDGAHIGPGARLCGNVRVGQRTLIGVGSAVRPGITIGSDVIVGAGSAVVGDLEDGGTYAGCPAQPLGRTARA